MHQREEQTKLEMNKMDKESEERKRREEQNHLQIMEQNKQDFQRAMKDSDDNVKLKLEQMRLEHEEKMMKLKAELENSKNQALNKPAESNQQTLQTPQTPQTPQIYNQNQYQPCPPNFVPTNQYLYSPNTTQYQPYPPYPSYPPYSYYPTYGQYPPPPYADPYRNAPNPQPYMTQPPMNNQPIAKPSPLNEMATPSAPNLSQSQNNIPNYYAPQSY